MKICTTCKCSKHFKDFSIHTGTGKLRAQCKTCVRMKILKRVRTVDGLITKIWYNQQASSKTRKLQPPTYNKKWLYAWITTNKKFRCMYDTWKNSGYITDLIPTVDRIYDHEGYTKTNIQLLTWRDNLDKAYRDIRNGVNTKNSTKVIQKNGDEEVIWESISRAARHTGIAGSSISLVCSGKRKTAGGFIWRYT